MFSLLAGRGRTTSSSPINMGGEKNYTGGGGGGGRETRVENDVSEREN